jgi:transposase
MSDAIGLAEALSGLDGFRVLTVTATDAEGVITVETTVDLVGCPACGTRAQARDRLRVDISDLRCFGCPARLVWMKRRWRCADADCTAKTWTEGSGHIAPRAVITLRAGLESTRQVGELGRSVAEVAREFGVCWWTIMDAVVLHGTPLIEDPGRVGALGIDETNYRAATKEHPTIYVRELVDLDRRMLIDMVEGNAVADLRRWCAARTRLGSRRSGWRPPT